MKLLKSFLFIAFALLGCSDYATTKIPIDPMGFSFEIPSQWEKDENIFVVPAPSENSVDFAFYFLTDAAKKQKKTLEANHDITPETVAKVCDKAYKLFKISVYPKENFSENFLQNAEWGKATKIGSNSDFLIYFSLAKKDEAVKKEFAASYKKYLAQSEKVEKTIEIFEPKGQNANASAPEVSGALNFTATDLSGKQIDSKSLFAQNKLTMVNIWGTYCGPCLREMPELAKLSQQTKNFAIVGIVVDGQNNIELAQEILAKSGANFVNLLPNSQLNEQILSSVSSIPTSFFVNQNGEIISQIIVGADINAYRKNIEKLLK